MNRIALVVSTLLMPMLMLTLTPATLYAEDTPGKISAHRDHPLYEAPEYTNEMCSYVDFRVISDIGYEFKISVPIDSINIKLRADGKGHTSLDCLVADEMLSSYAAATLLVPVPEDVAVWRAEVERWKAIRKRYLDSLPKPRRIIPKSH